MKNLITSTTSNRIKQRIMSLQGAIDRIYKQIETNSTLYAKTHSNYYIDANDRLSSAVDKKENQLADMMA